MFRSTTTVTGFNPRATPVASPRLINAVAVSLVLGAVALCVCVGLTLATSIPVFALPLAH